MAARLALEFRYYTILLPKLDVMAVDKLLRGFNRCNVVGTVGTYDYAVATPVEMRPMTFGTKH